MSTQGLKGCECPLGGVTGDTEGVGEGAGVATNTEGENAGEVGDGALAPKALADRSRTIVTTEDCLIQLIHVDRNVEQRGNDSERNRCTRQRSTRQVGIIEVETHEGQCCSI